MSRTGLHLHGAGQYARIVDYYRRSGSKVVKFMNFRDIDLMNELKAMGVTIIYRLHTDDQSLGGNRSKDFIRDLVGKVQGTPIDFAEGYNEAHGDRGDIGRYAAHEIDRMKALEAVGKKAIIGNFSLGTPEITDGGKTWEEFRPALRHALSNGHALGLHEYAGPYMQYYTKTPDGRNQWKNNAFTGISTDPAVYWNPALTGWVTLRYREVYALFRSWGLGDLPLYVTEGGIDDSIPRPGPNGRGYKDFQDGVWDRLPGIGDYAEQRRWYMWQASHDKYVKGVVDFGWQGTSTGWAAFDLETDPGMVERIIAREADLPITHHGASSPQPPPEQPMDAFSAILRRKLGNRFSDDRAIMPKHATAKFSPLNPAAYKGIAVHHSASARGTAPASIADYHVTHNGWAGIGYHVVIRQGVAHYVGDIATQRAHVAGRNHELAGICVTGDYTKEAPRTEDLDTLRLVIEALDELLGKALPINGHGGWALAGHKTECPGALVGPAREIRTGGGAPTQPPQPQPRPVQWGKVAWFVEDMVRRMEAEGLATEAALVKSTWLPEAIRHRDKPGG